MMTRLSLSVLSVLIFAVCGGVARADEPATSVTPVQQSEEGATAESTQEDFHNTLRWQTASEVDNFGFDIYRSLTEEGTFERITEDPIPGAGTVDEPQKYVFEDFEIDASLGYYYYIESISMAGVRERFSPIAFVKPKKPSADPTDCAATPTPAPLVAEEESGSGE